MQAAEMINMNNAKKIAIRISRNSFKPNDKLGVGIGPDDEKCGYALFEQHWTTQGFW
jgi:hypothetical protein